MAEIFDLKANEFAISTGSLFDFDTNGTVIKVNKDGTATITLNFKLVKSKDPQNPNIQNGPGVITIGDCGIFVIDDANTFAKSTVVSQLSLADNGNFQISIISDRNDIELLTKAVKGRQGNAIALKPNER
jgi:hypothetical protein